MPGHGREAGEKLLGFEAGGGFGQATLDFLQELVETAGEQSSADLYHCGVAAEDTESLMASPHSAGGSATQQGSGHRLRR